MSAQNILLTNLEIYTEDGTVKNGYIKVVDELIAEVGEMTKLTTNQGFELIKFPNKSKVIPGMIDVHIHGVNGADTMDATKESMQTMVDSLPAEGTTAFLATTITQGETAIENALRNAGEFIEHHQKVGQAELLGVHLEGPFINQKRAGAQPVDHIINPKLELFEEWQDIANNTIKLVTLAPEQDGALSLINYLKGSDVIASVGHSDATLKDIDQAIAAGLSHVTHLYNQMRELHHRELGVVGAALLRDELITEVIADGVHVQPEAIQLAYQQKTAERLILITDAMRAKCLKNGSYDLGGQQVTVKDDKAILADGTLAGSVLTMGQAFKNIIRYTNCTIEEAIKMSSTVPAKELKVFDRKGSISTGKDADLVILNEQLDITMTLCRGKIAYRKENNKE
ncbi:N-acetylglucosamine-6-phosphate deacetylase [Paraliobacillus quinghaiensis]|uniref:N-acetylglucosamine-6-phosphate deacetylase n=1 Tax=Paraliobacillus quinghaiensis TaxID=470815 RepID=A0A917WUZ7_9BACI|nr:N-acetylglucosamine-6-phosphate deacetylase [Paraliobacillus quinghaiensis]GGM30526.1 N-acetylglucosamine-6-phosphate deacetylase [Paraliobacillus quinghaiensis]